MINKEVIKDMSEKYINEALGKSVAIERIRLIYKLKELETTARRTRDLLDRLNNGNYEVIIVKDSLGISL